MIRESVEITAPAKVNLFLEVLGKRPDGYHDLESVFQTISICDHLTVGITAGDEIRLSCDVKSIETPDNIAVLAVRAFRDATGLEFGAKISLRKGIPLQSGLGGGSSDAAAVLSALNELFGRPMDMQALTDVAAGVGSDVPFFLYGGTARVTGRGERIEPINAKGEYTYVVYYPGFGVSTAEAYKNLRMELTYKRRSDKVLCELLLAGDFNTARDNFFNRLEETVFTLDSRLVEARAVMLGCVGDNGVMLCGSGASLFSAFVDADRASQACGRLRGIGRGEVFLAKTVTGSWNSGRAKGVGRGNL